MQTKIRTKKAQKAQLKTGETIIVLIIFFILLAGGMIFYAKIQKYTTSQKKQETAAVDAISIEQRIRHMTEIPCSIDGTIIFDCYDLEKIKGLQKTIPDYMLYYNSVIFKNSKVTITSVYPVAEEILLFDAETREISTGTQPYRTPVTLYDPLTNMYSFGYITIEVFTS